MAKLILLAAAFAALLAFASAHRTTVITAIEDDTYDVINPSISREELCAQHLQGQQLRQCRSYLQQPEQSFPIPFPFPFGQQQRQQALQQCCQELQNVNQMCQCRAIKQVFGDVQQQQQQQQTRPFGLPFGLPFGSQQIQQLKEKAENLPNQCNLQIRKECRIQTNDQQQCRQQIQGRQFNRCQRYVEQQTSSAHLRTVVWKQRQPEEVEQCCEELRNVERECQCEAMKEVLREAQQQMQQQRPEMMGEIGRIVQMLKNQCNLQVQQCQIPASMF